MFHGTQITSSQTSFTGDDCVFITGMVPPSAAMGRGYPGYGAMAPGYPGANPMVGTAYGYGK